MLRLDLRVGLLKESLQLFGFFSADFQKFKVCFWSAGFVCSIGQGSRCAIANGNRLFGWVRFQIKDVMEISIFVVQYKTANLRSSRKGYNFLSFLLRREDRPAFFCLFFRSCLMAVLAQCRNCLNLFPADSGETQLVNRTSSVSLPRASIRRPVIPPCYTASGSSPARTSPSTPPG